MRLYTVSQDKYGVWYAHPVGYPSYPCFGTFTQDKRKALRFAAEWSGLTLGEYMEIRKRGLKGGSHGNFD